jgi:hypothetical protein
MSSDETATRLQGLLDRLESLRARLDSAESSEAAVDILQELSELAKETQAEVERAQRAGPATRGDAPS